MKTPDTNIALVRSNAARKKALEKGNAPLPMNSSAIVVEPMPGYLVLDDKFGLRTERNLGGIVLPDTAKENKQAPVGKVIRVADDLKHIFQPGDVVYHHRNADHIVEVGQVRYRVIKLEGVICKISNYNTAKHA